MKYFSVTKRIIIFMAFFALFLCLAGCAKQSSHVFTVRYEATTGGKIEGEAEQQVYEGAGSLSVTAQPQDGYRFVEWSDGETSATRSEESVTGDLTFTAKFEKMMISIRYLSDGNGIIVGKKEQSVAYGGSASSVTAVSNEGYRFVKWSDGVTTAKRTDENIKENFTATAEFKKLTYYVGYSAGENGTIEGEANQRVPYGEGSAPVTAVPDEGYKFARWSDGIKTATRTDENVTKDFTVTAEFEKIRYMDVFYQIDCGGEIIDLTTGERAFSYTVPYGEDAPPVKAVPYEGMVFLYWSDGSTNPERHDTNIRFSFKRTAYFGYYIDYYVYGGEGGKIAGKAHQEALEYEDFQSVTAVPEKGYIFMGWSDGSTDPERRDNFKQTDKAFYAYFEPIEKKFRYDYGIASGMPTVGEVTINRYQIQNTKFVIPQVAGYTFCGWYADSDFEMKVANAGGKLFTGYYTFLLETDTLYAKWQKQGEEITTFKILMPVVDEVHALLYSTKVQKDIVADYKMSYMEKKIYALIVQKFTETLNGWFAGKVIFEVDAYYTIQPFGSTENRVGKSSFATTSSTKASYHLEPDWIPEIQDILDDYHVAISSDSLNGAKPEYFGEDTLRYHTGLAISRYATVCFDHLGLNRPYQKTYEDWRTSFNDVVLLMYLHEFVHTLERFSPDIYDYHDIISDYDDDLLATKLYLFHQAITPDGQIVGVPPKFWETPSLWGQSYIKDL